MSNFDIDFKSIYFQNLLLKKHNRVLIRSLPLELKGGGRSEGRKKTMSMREESGGLR